MLYLRSDLFFFLFSLLFSCMAQYLNALWVFRVFLTLGLQQNSFSFTEPSKGNLAWIVVANFVTSQGPDSKNVLALNYYYCYYYILLEPGSVFH